MCQLNKSCAIMDNHIEQIVLSTDGKQTVSVIYLKSRRTVTANGDWIKIITKAKQCGAVWCSASHHELRK